jgi:hypothetical protein
MSEQKPSGHSGQGSSTKPDPRKDGDSPKPHGDKLQHAVDEAGKTGNASKDRG